MLFNSTSNDSPSFVEVFTEQRRAKARNEFLERVDILIDWRPIQTLINKKLNKSAEAKGEPTYDGILMFKILLLEVWYNLSDRAVEERINDSITIEVADDREDNLSEKEKIEEEKYMSTLCSGKPGVDKEGKWVKKGSKYRFGYKKHVATTKEGLVEGIITTPANVSDTREFKALIDKLKLPESVAVLADKGYASRGNSAHLAEKGLTDKIMKKASRGKPLCEEEKEFNRLISKTRSKIERTFGNVSSG